MAGNEPRWQISDTKPFCLSDLKRNDYTPDKVTFPQDDPAPPGGGGVREAHQSVRLMLWGGRPGGSLGWPPVCMHRCSWRSPQTPLHLLTCWFSWLREKKVFNVFCTTFWICVCQWTGYLGRYIFITGGFYLLSSWEVAVFWGRPGLGAAFMCEQTWTFPWMAALTSQLFPVRRQTWSRNAWWKMGRLQCNFTETCLSFYCF